MLADKFSDILATVAGIALGLVGLYLLDQFVWPLFG